MTVESTMVKSSATVPSTTFKKEVEFQSHTIERRDMSGKVLSKVDLEPSIFGRKVNAYLMHQVVLAQLAAARQGTHSTLRQREVRGGGAKPFRQKGTGRARQGSTRASQWVGGGVPHGPKPRSYEQRTPKKMIKMALYSAVSDRASEGRIALIDEWRFATPSTKSALQALDANGLSGRLLIVLNDISNDTSVSDAYSVSNVELSLRNIPRVQIIKVGELNTYDVLRNDWLVFDDRSMDAFIAREGDKR